MSEDDRVMRELAEENVVHAAEEAAAGIRRLVVLHGLHPDLETGPYRELVDFVDDVCRHNGIETVGGVASPSGSVGPAHPARTHHPPGGTVSEYASHTEGALEEDAGRREQEIAVVSRLSRRSNRRRLPAPGR